MGWAFPQGLPLQEVGTLSGSLPPFVTATGSGTAHTKGSWAELVAATSNEWSAFTLLIQPTMTNATNTATLLDIGLGGSGSERVVVADLPVGYLNTLTGAPSTAYPRMVPLRVPAGERVAVRCQSAVTSKTVTLAVVGHYGRGLDADPSPAFATTYGTVSATSLGVTVPGHVSSANSYGAWTEIVSATTAPIHSLLVGVQGNGTATMQGRSWDLMLGLGASSSEVEFGHHFNFGGNTNEGLSYLRDLGIARPITGLNIPTGTRIAAALACDATSTPRDLDVSVVGFTY